MALRSIFALMRRIQVFHAEEGARAYIRLVAKAQRAKRKQAKPSYFSTTIKAIIAVQTRWKDDSGPWRARDGAERCSIDYVLHYLTTEDASAGL